MAQQLEPYSLAKFLEANGFVKNITCTTTALIPGEKITNHADWI